MTPDDLKRLPLHVRPPSAGGKGKLPVFELSMSAVVEPLTYRPDPVRPDRHGFIEPTGSMTLNDYQSALKMTQPNWREVP